jgi:hypothetical protein
VISARYTFVPPIITAQRTRASAVPSATQQQTDQQRPTAHMREGDPAPAPQAHVDRLSRPLRCCQRPSQAPRKQCVAIWYQLQTQHQPVSTTRGQLAPRYVHPSQMLMNNTLM